MLTGPVNRITRWLGGSDDDQEKRHSTTFPWSIASGVSVEPAAALGPDGASGESAASRLMFLAPDTVIEVRLLCDLRQIVCLFLLYYRCSVSVCVFWEQQQQQQRHHA